MDKHKALIERLTCEIVDAAQDNGSEIGGAFARKLATAALNAVYEALKEPSEDMLRVPLGQTTGPDVSFNGELLSRDRFESRRDLRPTIWQAMLSASALSSPLGKGE